MIGRPEILLHPNIPKPLHGLSPRTICGQEWWDQERQKAYASTDYHCAACGVHKNEALYHHWLEAHELYHYDYPNGTAEMVEIVPLCHACHNFIHSGRMAALVSRGEMTAMDRNAIIFHGNEILRIAGLVKPEPPQKVAPWDQWRLILNGNTYKGKFKNFAAWAAYYQKEGTR